MERPERNRRGEAMRKVVRYALVAGLLSFGVENAAAQELFVYPAKGQTDQQMAQDKEECHGWAVTQTGVDPVQLAEAAAAPPAKSGGGGGGALGGAAMGAARGAISGGDVGAGAMQGVGIGRLIHAVRARRQMEEQQSAAAQAQQERQAQLQKYDRAFGACLTGRGYTVQ
jgi:predicted lipid-binding transport protein (Tim44 family)